MPSSPSAPQPLQDSTTTLLKMVGARLPREKIVYPVSALALRHGAGVDKRTPVPRVAYAGSPPWKRLRGRAPWPALGG